MLGMFFPARVEEVESLVEAGPARTPEVVEAKGLSEVSLSTLGEIMQVGSYDDLVVHIGDGPQDQSGEAGILPLPDAFRDALASSTDLDAVAEQWTATEELTMDGWQPSDAADVLRDLAELARNAKADGRQLFYWWSL